MPGITADNPHAEHLPCCQVVYWRGNVACGKNDEWTRAQIFAPRHMGTCVFTIRSDERGRIEEIVRFAQKVFDEGKRAKAEEIRDALGVRPN